MSHSADTPLSSQAKLVRVVLDNCGPLSPPEIAQEAHITEQSAKQALRELEDANEVKCVCGMAKSKEEIYALQSET
ncbi:MAG: hypothetical protein ABEI06_00200 [Halobacteriaceae archaeon]